MDQVTISIEVNDYGDSQGSKTVIMHINFGVLDSTVQLAVSWSSITET